MKDEIVFIKKNAYEYYRDCLKYYSQVKDLYCIDKLTQYPEIRDYVSKKESHNFALSTHIKFKENNGKIFYLSSDKKFQNIVLKKNISSSEVKFSNLLRNTTYFWKTTNNKNEIVETGSFHYADLPRCLLFTRLRNVRDFGGYLTKSGKRIKQNLLFRGSEINLAGYVNPINEKEKHYKTLSKKSLTSLRNLIGSGIEIDLRRDNESNNISQSILNSKNHPFSYYRAGLMVPYEAFLNCEDSVFINQIHHIFELFANADRQRIYLHCWGGADRTGTLCFVLGALLGMNIVDLIIEFELTSFSGGLRCHRNDGSWVTFYKFYDQLFDYSKNNNLSNDLQEIIEHLLINKFLISEKTITKIKKIFLEN